MIQGKLLSYGSDLKEVYRIRNEVFVEELGYPEKEVFDDQDQEAIHALVYEELSGIGKEENKNAVATGRIVLDGNRCIINQIAVLKEYRNNAYGDFTVKTLLNKAFTSGISEVVLLSPQDTEEFFKKIGFKIKCSETGEDGKTLFTMIIHANDIVKTCKRCIS